MQANGELYYFATMLAFGVITFVNPELWISVYDNFGSILGVLNVLALAFCLYLLVQAKMKQNEEDPYLLNNVSCRCLVPSIKTQFESPAPLFHYIEVSNFA